MFDLTNRVAVVTGASSGLGVQFAKALAEQGADIAILARRKDKLDAVAEEIRKTGRKCFPVVCDVTVTADVQNAVAAVIKEYGKVDILVNNAGLGAVAPAEEMTDDMWNKDIAVDLTGVFTVAREFGKEMIKKKYGRIINIASMYGVIGNNFMPTVSYHAAKGGVVNFTRALASEWAKHGITVNAIGPGFFPSELTQSAFETKEFQEYLKLMVPMGRPGREGELNPALIYLASNEATYTTGTITLVDGGQTCI
ncbi:Gluconate 5-dehydrogenase [Methanosarcinaceae archaeon Ag5]|uniref:Gluconate 5-dehydrogenase n=2 Tax=Methanolapillus africanus TaxID=3028297 RepID=A0AAE4SDK9_9EURY|nr:Gluconate 5-dehydrogenase [Methanosarcinaceae archaeon Ag5]